MIFDSTPESRSARPSPSTQIAIDPANGRRDSTMWSARAVTGVIVIETHPVGTHSAEYRFIEFTGRLEGKSSE